MPIICLQNKVLLPQCCVISTAYRFNRALIHASKDSDRLHIILEKLFDFVNLDFKLGFLLGRDYIDLSHPQEMLTYLKRVDSLVIKPQHNLERIKIFIFLGFCIVGIFGIQITFMAGSIGGTYKIMQRII